MFSSCSIPRLPTGNLPFTDRWLHARRPVNETNIRMHDAVLLVIYDIISRHNSQDITETLRLSMLLFYYLGWLLFFWRIRMQCLGFLGTSDGTSDRKSLWIFFFFLFSFCKMADTMISMHQVHQAPIYNTFSGILQEFTPTCSDKKAYKNVCSGMQFHTLFTTISQRSNVSLYIIIEKVASSGWFTDCGSSSQWRQRWQLSLRAPTRNLPGQAHNDGKGGCLWRCGSCSAMKDV